MSDVLERICADKRAHIARRKSVASLGDLERQARQAPLPRGFEAALRRVSESFGYALICEIKKASPSRGLIREDYDPARLAEAYRQGGATCLSVLTDEPYFQGADADLRAARAAVDLPVLRKDFMLDPYQIVESRALGADCILLIMAALGDDLARDLAIEARRLGMDVLVEVHDARELERALALEIGLVGINNRNLKTLDVDLETTRQLAPKVSAKRLVVAESGLNSRADLEDMAASGARAFLIGESLMRQDDVAAATRKLLPEGAASPAAAGGV